MERYSETIENNSDRNRDEEQKNDINKREEIQEEKIRDFAIWDNSTRIIAQTSQEIQSHE